MRIATFQTWEEIFGHILIFFRLSRYPSNIKPDTETAFSFPPYRTNFWFQGPVLSFETALHHPIKDTAGSGQLPQTNGRSPSFPLNGTKTLSFCLFSSISDTYTKPITLASRMVSCKS